MAAGKDFKPPRHKAIDRRVEHLERDLIGPVKGTAEAVTCAVQRGSSVATLSTFPPLKSPLRRLSEMVGGAISFGSIGPETGCMSKSRTSETRVAG
jgi:hypothetical protein